MHTINFALIGLLLLAIAVILGLLRSRGDAAPSGRWPYFAKKALSRPEQVLYFRLVRALPDNIVLAQVQLSRILGVKRGSDYQSWLKPHQSNERRLLGVREGCDGARRGRTRRRIAFKQPACSSGRKERPCTGRGWDKDRAVGNQRAARRGSHSLVAPPVDAGMGSPARAFNRDRTSRHSLTLRRIVPASIYAVIWRVGEAGWRARARARRVSLMHAGGGTVR